LWTGLNLACAVTPEGFADFVDLVVPEQCSLSMHATVHNTLQPATPPHLPMLIADLPS
jgi:hypothetical protein